MPNALFEIPFDRRDYNNTLTNGPAAQALNSLNANHGELDLNANKLELYISIKEFRARYPGYLPNYLGVGFTKAKAKAWETQNYKDLVKQNLLTARNALRQPTFQYPPVDATVNCGLNGTETPDDAIDQLLGANRGFCLGYGHTQVDARAALRDALDAAPPNAPEILFIEEFPVELQDDIDAFLTNNDPNAPVPNRLSKWLEEKDGSRGGQELPDGWFSVLRKAKAKNARIFGIDSLTAGDSSQPDHGAAQMEQRDVLMNKVAKDVLDRVLNDNQFAGKKFIAGMGAAHMNTQEGGVPGLAQMLGVPAMKFDPATKKFVPEPEDQTKRAMPSAVEQEFMDEYILRAEASLLNEGGQYPLPDGANGNDHDNNIVLFKNQLYANAKVTAARLLDEGELTPPKTPATALAENGIKSQIEAVTELFKNWSKRDAEPDQVAKLAVRARQDTMLDTVVQAHPDVLQNREPSNGDSLFHLAAKVRSPECMGKLIGKLTTTPNADQAVLSARNNAGDTAAHLAIEQRSDGSPGRMARQTGVMEQLFGAGVSPDILDGRGRTPLHVAALKNNMPAVQALHNRNANKTIVDGRNWTACDVAIASTKTGIESFLVANGGGNNNAKIPPNMTTDTIAALMSVVKCENPNDVGKCQAALEKLYKIPEMRPMLKMLALDALSPRDTQNGTGLRIVIADDDKVGPLFAAPGTGGQGSYDEGAHVVMVGSKSSNDFAGVLAHEFTHCAARLTTGNTDTVPFANNNDRDAYRRAILEDMKGSASLMDKGGDKKAIRGLDGRMDDYIYQDRASKTRKSDQAVRLKLDQEQIVNVSQLMAEFGPDAAQRLVPNLKNYFSNTFTPMINTKAQQLQLGGNLAGINDNGLDTTAFAFQGEPPIAPPDDVLALALDIAKKQFRIKRGTARPDGNIAQLDDFQLSPGDQQNLQIREQLAKQALEPLRGKLPPACSADALRALGEQIGAAITDKPIHEVDRIATVIMDKWVRDAQVDYAKEQVGKGVIDNRQLAEAIVAKAEGVAWQQANQGRLNQGRLEIDEDKHKKLVTDLVSKLSKFPDDKKNAYLIDQLSMPLSKNGTSAFYRKRENQPRHVSIDVGGAKNWWLAELKRLKKAA